MRPRPILWITLFLALALAPAGASAEPFLTPFSNNAVPLAPGPFTIALSLPKFGPPVGPGSTLYLEVRVEVEGAAGSALDLRSGPEPVASAGDVLTWSLAAPGLSAAGPPGPVFALAGAELERGVPLLLAPAVGPGSLAAGRVYSTTITGALLAGYLGTGAFDAAVTGSYGLADPGEPTALRVTGGRIVATLGVELAPFTIPPDEPPGPPPGPAGVPEPGTLGAAALGAVAFGAGVFLRRKRRGRDPSRRGPARRYGV